MQLTIAPPMGADSANGRLPAPTGIPVEEPPAIVRIGEARGEHAPGRFRTVGAAVLGTAALFLLGAIGFHQAGLMSFNLRQEQPVAQGWGWERPGAIPSEGPADAYLLKLAHAANDWFNKRPSEREAVAQRIREFSRGCQILIDSPHDPLSPDDKQWLVEKCKAWKDTLDAHVAALDAGDDPLTVRAAADVTIDKLIKAIRTRADEIG